LVPEAEVDHIEKCEPIQHCECGHQVELTSHYHRHQVHELPRVKAIVTEYQLYVGVCCGCKNIQYADLPVGVPTGMLGPVALSKVGTLTGDYRMSKRNVVNLFEDFYGLSVSVGTISNAEKIVSSALCSPVEEAKQYIPQQEVVNSDETSHAEKGKKMFYHWHKFKKGKLSREQLKQMMCPTQKRVETLLIEGLCCSNKKTARTCREILKVKEAMWTFVEKGSVEPTNNIAEQVIRRIVIWRKTSLGTISQWNIIP